MSHDERNSTDRRERQTAAPTARQATGASGPRLMAEDEQGSPSTENSHPQSSTQATVQTEPTILTEGQNDRRQRLETFVADFRGGKKTRVETYSDILGELEREPELTHEEKETTFNIISAELDSTENRARRHFSLSKSNDKAVSPQPNRRRDNQSEDDSGTDDEESRPKKKSRLLETDMPWYTHSELDELGVSPTSAKTIELLRIYNRDIKKCKFYVSVSTGAPDNIPSAQWEHIFKGEPVDLDQILSALYRITVVEDRKARIGETEISLGPAEASRKVSTSTDWSTAWRRAARATAYAFPHRSKEVGDYAEYIENEFAAKNSSSHHRIILYDVAIRNLVRGGQHILLTDIHKFVSLYSAIVMPDGVQYGNQRGPTRKREELCNRFNDKGCKASNCRYRHACKACGSTAHGKHNCNAATRN
jgi:hypothetical protein